MVVGEPYFSSAILPWHSLHFWYMRTYVDHLLSDQLKIIPFKAHLQAIAGSGYINYTVFVCIVFCSEI